MTLTSDLADALAHPDLLLNLIWAELMARYKTTAFGLLWFIVNPMVLMGILVMIFGQVVHLSIRNYLAFVLSALLPWTFFQMEVTNAAGSLSRAAGLVKRVRSLREFVPLGPDGGPYPFLNLPRAIVCLDVVPERARVPLDNLSTGRDRHSADLSDRRRIATGEPQCSVSRCRTYAVARLAGAVLRQSDFLP